jgi:hypothetical protein
MLWAGGVEMPSSLLINPDIVDVHIFRPLGRGIRRARPRALRAYGKIEEYEHLVIVNYFRNIVMLRHDPVDVVNQIGRRPAHAIDVITGEWIRSAFGGSEEV